MATITGLTAERMQAIIDDTVTGAHISGDNLILELYDGDTIDAGSVRGVQGVPGATFTICTSTTRPTGLTTLDEGLAIYETDTNLVRIWTGARWRLQERVICTSSTRPASLVSADEGVEIYETDTDLEYVWSGSAWILAPIYFTFASATARSTAITSPTEGMASFLRDVDAFEIYAGTSWKKPWNMPWGYITQAETTGDITGITTIADVLTVNFTAVANRRYRITGDAQCTQRGGDGTSTLFLRNAANTILQQRGFYAAGNGLSFPLHYDKVLSSLAAGATTLKMSLNTGTNSVDLQGGSGRPAVLLVEDIGPNGTAT
jgi:hypothetical protein